MISTQDLSTLFYVQHSARRSNTGDRSASSSRFATRQRPDTADNAMTRRTTSQSPIRVGTNTLLSRSYMFNPPLHLREDGTIDRRGMLKVDSQVFSPVFSTGDKELTDYTNESRATKQATSHSKKLALRPLKLNSIDIHSNRTPRKATRNHYIERNAKDLPASSRMLGFPSEITQMALRKHT